MSQLLAKKTTYSPIEYLERELVADMRHEYINGEIIQMTGGLPNHNQVAGNLYAALNFGLRRRPYRVYVTDQRLWIPEMRIYTYPDVMVIAEPLQLQEGRRDTVTNPIAIAEVLSSSTRGYDCSEKFEAYRTIPSFQEYLLLAQDKLQVMQYVKQGEHHWLFTEYTKSEDVIIWKSFTFEISMSDLYDKVDFA